ncbi:guided entry of tail-anchored proteins factor 1 isoform X2 [Parasteatoda tepidariorum]|nr:guided entry of tail-anchored proteins factor 1 isoform X2 [Parasteatoda tepidariorum]
MENNLRRQVCDLKAELGSISMVDEFAKYAKIKRKINKATDELTHQSDVRTSYKMRMHLIYTASLYAVLGCTVVFLLWNYRKEPIVILPRNWLYPFESLLSYPSDVPGSISLTSWLFVTSTAAKAMAKSLKL